MAGENGLGVVKVAIARQGMRDNRLLSTFWLISPASKLAMLCAPVNFAEISFEATMNGIEEIGVRHRGAVLGDKIRRPETDRARTVAVVCSRSNTVGDLNLWMDPTGRAERLPVRIAFAVDRFSRYPV